jgi:hypothetical protein
VDTYGIPAVLGFRSILAGWASLRRKSRKFVRKITKAALLSCGAFGALKQACAPGRRLPVEPAVNRARLNGCALVRRVTDRFCYQMRI